MKEIVSKDQAGDIGIWGKVERVAGFETDVYDFWIAVADFSVDPPRMIYQKKARTQTVSEIPHIYVKEALDALYGRPAPVEKIPDPALLERWDKAANLVQGDFERGGAAPLGWGPLPHDVTWVTENRQAEIEESHHSLHPERGRGRDVGRALLQRFLPGRGGGHLSFPLPMEDRPVRRPRSSSSAMTSCRPSSGPAPSPTRPGRKDARSTETSKISRGARGSGTYRPRISRLSTPTSPRAGDG